MRPVVTQLAGQRVFPGAHRHLQGRRAWNKQMAAAQCTYFSVLEVCQWVFLPLLVLAQPSTGFTPEVRVRESKLRDEGGWVFRYCKEFTEPLC